MRAKASKIMHWELYVTKRTGVVSGSFWYLMPFSMRAHTFLLWSSLVFVNHRPDTAASTQCFGYFYREE